MLISLINESLDVKCLHLKKLGFIITPYKGKWYCRFSEHKLKKNILNDLLWDNKEELCNFLINTFEIKILKENWTQNEVKELMERAFDYGSYLTLRDYDSPQSVKDKLNIERNNFINKFI